MQVTKPPGAGDCAPDFIVNNGKTEYHVFNGVIRASLTDPLVRPESRLVNPKNHPSLVARINDAIALFMADDSQDPATQGNTSVVAESDRWRNLALASEDHRSKALWHLKRLLNDPEGHRAAVELFLNTSQCNGPKTLAKRIKATSKAEKKPSISVAPFYRKNGISPSTAAIKDRIVRS